MMLHKVVSREYAGNKLLLTLECGHIVEWESDPMMVPPAHMCTHRCDKEEDKS
jgi:hypothetical protein